MFKELDTLRLRHCDLLVRERVIRHTDQRHPRNAVALTMNLHEQTKALEAIQECLSRHASCVPTIQFEPISCTLDTMVDSRIPVKSIQN